LRLAGQLQMRMVNITPDGEEMLAVQAVYTGVKFSNDTF